MQNTVRDEAQAGIRIARRNINNLRYADGITPMAGSKEELKSLSKTKIMASGLIASWQIDGETLETVTDFFWALKSLQMVTAAMKLKDAYSLEGNL